VETNSITRRVGAGAVTFDGGTFRAVATSAEIFSDFAAGDIAFAAGGATIDTAGFNITTRAQLSGVGGLTKIGLESLTLGGSFGSDRWGSYSFRLLQSSERRYGRSVDVRLSGKYDFSV
jgi:hypothetical protein